MHQLENKEIIESIVKTLSYSDIFAYPLRRCEIYRYYIGKKIPSKTVYSTILQMVRKGQIERARGFYFLNGRRKPCSIRKKREKESSRKWRIARRAAKILAIIPTVKLIGVSGSLSMSNCERRDDIDLFFITSAKTLWMTRLLINSLLLLWGKKRSRDDLFGVDRICPNMFISSESLEIDKNIFSAHEIAQLKPMVNKNSTYEKFITANSRVLKFLPHAISVRKVNRIESKGSSTLGLIDKLFYLLQYKYMKKRITSEKISGSQVLFHPKDKTNFVLALYKARYKSYLKYLSEREIHQSQKSFFTGALDTPGY